MPSRALVRSLLRFLLVGGGTTGAVYLLFTQLVRWGVGYRAASVAGWALGVGLGYLLNKRFTFEIRQGATVREVATFLAGYGLQLGLGLMGYTVLMGWLGVDKTPAFVIVTGVTAAFSFLFMRFAVFRPAPGPAA